MTDFLSSTTAGTTAGIDGAFMPSVKKTHRVRLPRLMYGDWWLLKVYNTRKHKSSDVAVHLSSLGAKPQTKEAPLLAGMDAATFKVSIMLLI